MFRKKFKYRYIDPRANTGWPGWKGVVLGILGYSLVISPAFAVIYIVDRYGLTGLPALGVTAVAVIMYYASLFLLDDLERLFKRKFKYRHSDPRASTGLPQWIGAVIGIVILGIMASPAIAAIYIIDVYSLSGLPALGIAIAAVSLCFGMWFLFTG